jgi:hypothetical protein
MVAVLRILKGCVVEASNTACSGVRLLNVGHLLEMLQLDCLTIASQAV